MSNLDVKRPAGTTQPMETPEEREARVHREAVIIAQGRADIDAGLGIELDALEAWLKRLEIDENAQLPVQRPQTLCFLTLRLPRKQARK